MLTVVTLTENCQGPGWGHFCVHQPTSPASLASVDRVSQCKPSTAPASRHLVVFQLTRLTVSLDLTRWESVRAQHSADTSQHCEHSEHA